MYRDPGRAARAATASIALTRIGASASRRMRPYIALEAPPPLVSPLITYGHVGRTIRRGLRHYADAV
jgi:hypothetical protein